MSKQPLETGTDTLSAQAVADYLQHHRDFFLHHPQLLPELELPHPGTGAAVSLIERQVAVLREQRQELKRKLQQLTQTARDNEHLLERIERLILRLLEADSHEALQLRLRSSLREDFHADTVELHFTTPGNSAVQQAFGKVIAGRSPVCGHLAPAQTQYLFGKAAEELASGAVIPLYDAGGGQCIALLGIGSIDPKRFHAEMGTTFLRYLGSVLELLLRRAEHS